MSRVAVLGSNALATTVQFYAAALEEAVQRADRTEALLKQVMTPRADPTADEFFDAVQVVLNSNNLKPGEKLTAIWEATSTTHERRRQSAARSATPGPDVVPADDAPRGGAVRDPNLRG